MQEKCEKVRVKSAKIFNDNTYIMLYLRFLVHFIYSLNVLLIFERLFPGTAGDSLSRHNGFSFTTRDQDNEGNGCAEIYKGAWWYFGCHYSNLNGLYHHGAHSSYGNGVNWYHWKGYYYSLKKAEMKIRPVQF